MPRTLDALPPMMEVLSEDWGTDFGPLLSGMFARDVRLMGGLDGSVVVFRNADLRALAANKDVGNLPAPMLTSAFQAAGPGIGAGFEGLVSNHIFTMNPPSHGPMRKLFARQFLPNRVDRFRAVAERVVRAQLEVSASGEEIDAVEDLAFPVAVRFWGELIGLTADEVDEIVAMSKQVAPAFFFLRSEEQARAVDDVARRYLTLVSSAIDRTLAGSPPEYLADMAAEFRNADVDKPATVGTMLAAVLMDGFHTLGVGIANVVYELLSHPEALAAVRADRGLVSSAFHEGIRLAPPSVFTQRCALADVEYDDVLIPAGTPITMFWLAGNRDPLVFEAPNEYSLGRKAAAQSTFGGGIHLCPGRSIAKMVIEVALTAVTAEDIDPQLVDAGAGSVWLPASSMFEPSSLPMRLCRV